MFPGRNSHGEGSTTYQRHHEEKRVPDATGESFVVVNQAPNGQAEPFFDRTREVWVAAAFGDLAEGFNAETTVSQLSAWWLEHVARHRVRPTSLATYRKHVTVIDAKLGSIPVRELRPEQVTTFVSDMIDDGSASRARNVRTLLVQILGAGFVSEDRREPTFNPPGKRRYVARSQRSGPRSIVTRPGHARHRPISARSSAGTSPMTRGGPRDGNGPRTPDRWRTFPTALGSRKCRIGSGVTGCGPNGGEHCFLSRAASTYSDDFRAAGLLDRVPVCIDRCVVETMS